MSYENAVSTILLATHCCACGRALRDAESVTAGMGPECREKYGVPETLTAEQRDLANALIHQAGILQKCAEVVTVIDELRALGCDAIADRLDERIAKLPTVEIIEMDGRYEIDHPKVGRDDFYALLNDIKAIPGRKWDAADKKWTFPRTTEARQALFAILSKWWPGTVGKGPKGRFVVPTGYQAPAPTAKAPEKAPEITRGPAQGQLFAAPAYQPPTP